MIIAHWIAKNLRTKCSFIIPNQLYQKTTPRLRKLRCVRGTVRVHACTRACVSSQTWQPCCVHYDSDVARRPFKLLTRIATAKWSRIRRNWSIGGLKSDLRRSREWTLRGVQAYLILGILVGIPSTVVLVWGTCRSRQISHVPRLAPCWGHYVCLGHFKPYSNELSLAVYIPKIS